MPTVVELAAWYRQLVAKGTFTSSCEGQAFFYEACWSYDADLERVFEDWIADQGNPRSLPLDLFEEELVHAERFDELHAFLSRLDAPQLARAVPMMRAFVANPKKGRARFESTAE